MATLRRSATINIHTGLRRFLSDYVAKLDNKKTIPALAWLERRGEGREERETKEENNFTPVKVVNRNSVEEDEDEEESDTETDNESSLVAADANQSWPDSEEEEEDANIDFEDFSGTDTEDEEGGFELSDTEEEDEEERDKFEELAIPPDRRASTVSQIGMHPIEQGEPSKLVDQTPKSVTERENEGEEKNSSETGGGWQRWFRKQRGLSAREARRWFDPARIDGGAFCASRAEGGQTPTLPVHVWDKE